MAIQITAKTMDEVPEEMREFVTEKDGVFSYDNEKAFKALKDEREISKSAKAAYAPYKALGMTAEQITAKIKEFEDLGKTPAEIAELIAKAEKPAPKPDFKKSTEYLEQQKTIEELLKFKQNYEAEAAKNLKNLRNDLVRKAILAQPDKVDKEALLSIIEDTNLFDRFALNDTKDGLAPISDKLPADFLTDFAERHRCIKVSTPGNATPGNATIKTVGGAEYAAAKDKGDIQGMLANCPTLE